MSPIKSLTDSVRLPRIGKIHLGTRDSDRGFPRKSDHFVFPPDHSDYKKLVELYGETPKSLNILIPVEDEEVWATQYFKSYNQTYGLVCKGDGEMAMRMVSVETGELPKADRAGTVTMKEIPCLGRDCPIYQNKEKGKPQCHEVMNLRFILPEVPGLGVWQIDTGSKNSILNINSCAKIIKRAFGRISMIPLKLTFEPIEVNQPDTGKKQTVYVLNLRTDVTMAQLADAAREQAKMFMLEAPTLENAFDVEVEKDIEELWGEKPIDKTTDELIEPPPEEHKVEPKRKPKDKPESEATPEKVKGEYADSSAYAAKKAQQATAEATPEKNSALQELDFDPIVLKEQLAEVKWRDATVKSFCRNKYSLDAEGQPLDIKLELVDFIASLKRQDRESLFREISDRTSML